MKDSIYTKALEQEPHHQILFSVITQDTEEWWLESFKWEDLNNLAYKIQKLNTGTGEPYATVSTIK